MTNVNWIYTEHIPSAKRDEEEIEVNKKIYHMIITQTLFRREKSSNVRFDLTLWVKISLYIDLFALSFYSHIMCNWQIRQCPLVGYSSYEFEFPRLESDRWMQIKERRFQKNVYKHQVSRPKKHDTRTLTFPNYHDIPDSPARKKNKTKTKRRNNEDQNLSRRNKVAKTNQNNPIYMENRMRRRSIAAKKSHKWRRRKKRIDLIFKC